MIESFAGVDAFDYYLNGSVVQFKKSIPFCSSLRIKRFLNEKCTF